jgi:hypothetical protein
VFLKRPCRCVDSEAEGKAGAMLYVSDPVPAPPVIGVKLAAAWFCVSVLDAMICVAVTAGLTDT